MSDRVIREPFPIVSVEKSSFKETYGGAEDIVMVFCSDRIRINEGCFIKGMTSGIRKISKEFTSTVDELTNLDEVKDIKKEILDTKESIIKDGKELDEFIDKSNKEIMDDKNK